MNFKTNENTMKTSHGNPTEVGLEQLAKDAGKKVGDMGSEIAAKASTYVKTGREYVAENPVKGVAIAAAAGAVVGSLLTLGLRRNK